MDEEVLKPKAKPNIFLTSLTARTDDNFFASSPKIELEKIPKNKPLPTSRINDFDSNILENNAYQLMSDDLFKLEHKISILEEALSKVNNEIETLENFGYGIQVNNLKDRRQKMTQELADLTKKYSDLGLSAKLSGQITSAVHFTSKKTNVFTKIKRYFSVKILARLSKKFQYNQAMTEALNNLSNINTSVDELINMHVPFGENITRYEKLTAYLNKANVIHSQIYKNVNAITKKKL